MTPERIKPAWRCSQYSHKGVYTEPGRCNRCGKRLEKFTPLSDLPTIWRCKTCREVFPTAPKERKDHLWICPRCKTPTVSAWGCSQQQVNELKAKLAGEKNKAEPYRFSRTVKHAFQISDAISQAAFKAQQLAERLSERRPKDGDDTGYIDNVTFDISRFNLRAQMIADMVMVRSLLKEAGLSEYTDSALNRILDTRLGTRLKRSETSKK